MKHANMMPSAFIGNYGSVQSKKSKKGKSGNSQYDEDMKKLLQKLGLDPEEENMMWLGDTQMYGSGRPMQGEGFGQAPMSAYGMVPSMGRGMQGYNPMMQPQGIPMQGMAGGRSMLNISYLAADGTAYQFSVSPSEENKGKAYDNVLGMLYGLMMSEDSGKGGKSYGKSGYAGRKGK